MCTWVERAGVKKYELMVLFLVLVGCGKNDIRSVPPTPVPPPSNYPGPGGQYYDPSSCQIPGYGGNCQGFRPEFNYPGFPPYAYPYAPIYPYLVHSGAWGPWVQYCEWRGLDPYQNFNEFWFDYCPDRCDPLMYRYYDDRFYWWLTPSYRFSLTGAPGFWSYYDGIPIHCGRTGCY